MKAAIPLVALALLVGANPLSAATLVVPDQYASIGAAILAATNGDTVFVRAGTYVENLNFMGKGISLVSEDGPVATIIDGSNPSHPDSGSVLFIPPAPTPILVRGFTITGGSGTLDQNMFSRRAGGIYLLTAGAIKDSWITENHAASITGVAGGIEVAAQGVTLQGNRIYSNTAGLSSSGSRGGGILINGSDTIIEDNVVFANQALGEPGTGGGCYADGITTFLHNVFACNRGSNRGTAINGAYLIENCTIVGNSGLHPAFDSALGRVQTVRRSSITSNVGPGIDACNHLTTPCNNFFDNIGDDPACYDAGNGNISVEPLYEETQCGSTFCLLPESPLLPENSPPGCGLIGASEQCVSTAIDAPTSPDYASGPLVARPNPFNPATTIAFVLPGRRSLTLAVYDTSGRAVRILFDGTLPSGPHEIVWDGRDSRGTLVESGAYIAVLQSPEARWSQKLLLVK